MDERLLNSATRFYVVQRGDTLSQVGKRIGVHWRALANLNRLRDPHLIYPGQLIQMPG